MNILNSLWNFHQVLVSSLGEQLWLKCKLKVEVSQKVKSKLDYRNEAENINCNQEETALWKWGLFSF
jgi:hypothetical protein